MGLLGELGATWSRAGPAAAADRRALRPVRQPRARAVVVRHLRGRAVDPRRHALRRHARARGRGAPIDHHARRSGSSSRAASPGSRPSDRISSGRCSPRSARLGRQRRQAAYFRLSTRPIDQALAAVPADRRARGSSGACRCSRAATSCGRPTRRTGRHARRHGRRPAGRARRGRRSSRPAAPPSTSSASPPPTSSSVRCRRVRDSRRRGVRDPRRALPERAQAAPIVAVLDGHPHTLAFLSADPRACRSPASACSDFGQSGDVPDLYAHFGIDAETIIGAALDLADGR